MKKLEPICKRWPDHCDCAQPCDNEGLVNHVQFAGILVLSCLMAAAVIVIGVLFIGSLVYDNLSH